MRTDLTDVDTRTGQRPSVVGYACGCTRDQAMPVFAKMLLELSASLLVIVSWQKNQPLFLTPRMERAARARATTFLRTCQDPVIALMGAVPKIHGADIPALRRTLIQTMTFASHVDDVLQETLTLPKSRPGSRSATADFVGLLDTLRRVLAEVIWTIRDNRAWTQDIEDWRFWQSNIMHAAPYEVMVQAHLDDQDWHDRSPEAPYASRA